MTKEINITLEIQNKKGLHARAAAAFVKAISPFDAQICVERLGQEVSGCSIMGLMMLAASKGTTINIKASGKDAQKAVDALKELINNKFNED